ncbi:hypothetical protein U5B43_07275 [Campylobacter sp. 9BO]|uniref:hypothetical protein n=1 Tax=Campylobacter sp. 9BO TaxID=3424759 RepID=UPI003D329272
MENKPNMLQRASYIANFADMIIDLAVIADVSERNKMIEILANNIKEQADGLQDDIVFSMKSTSGSFLKDNRRDRNTSRE